MSVLTSKQAAHLRALAHHLEPVVQVGKDGVTEALVASLGEALAAHELVKVRLPQVERSERAAMASALGAQSGAALVGELGRIAIFYRRHPKRPVIEVPGQRAARTDDKRLPPSRRTAAKKKRASDEKKARPPKDTSRTRTY